MEPLLKDISDISYNVLFYRDIMEPLLKDISDISYNLLFYRYFAYQAFSLFNVQH